MGNTQSQSTINQVNNQLVISEDDVKIHSEDINNFITNTAISDYKSCSNAINELQNIKFGPIDVEGNLNISGISQKQQAAITFDCYQSSTVRQEVGQEMIANMMNNLQNTVSQEILSKMNANAKAAAESSFGAIGNVQSNTNVNSFNNYKSVTKNYKDIENVLKNNVENNFTQEMMSSCVNNVNTSQNIEFQDIKVKGNANIRAINQEQGSIVFAECIQNNNTGNKIMNAALGMLGVKSEDTTRITAKTEMAAETSATAHQAGFFESIGKALGDVLSGITSMFSGESGMVCCVCACMVICIVLAVMTG